jgi:signal transduction histidine kinase
MIDSTLKNANILIVDDQEANICVLEGFLDIQGYSNIKTTQDPREVVHLLASFDPDLILLDLSMPYISGFEVMKQIKSVISENTYLPILVLTADVTPSAKQRALSGGASDFLTKPFDLVEVGLRIRNLLFTSFLQQQLQNQNHVLEEKVKERTRELETKNIELTLAKNRAEASDKLKGTFINNISHEIRTPLNGILGFGQILTDPDLTTEEREQYSEMLNDSSARLVNTITNFMDISLLTSGNQKVYKKEVNIENSFTEIINKFKDVCQKKNLVLSTELHNNKIKIITDSELLGKILYQLTDNSVKFTQQGSVVIGCKINRSDVLFWVKDSGIGISEKNKEQIFDSFIQEDGAITRKYEGSGLGLAIAQRLVKLLGGTIWLESEKSKGTAFYFTIPYQEEDKTEKKGQRITEQKQTPAKQTILIAEDDDINYQYFKALLSYDSVLVLRASNGIEAVKICREHPEVNIVLMDLRMWEMDGFEATTQIKSFRNNLPIIAVTAYSEGEDKQKALEAGCDDFITKPVKKELLIKKIEDFGLTFQKTT